MTALSRIRQAGFDISLFGDSFKIEPSSKLTQQQREFLKSHKAEIMNELIAANLRAEQATNEIISNLIVMCYTPNGKAIEVEATSEEHAAWLKRMNPQPKGKQS